VSGIRIFIDVDEWLDALDAHEGPGVETLLELQAVMGLAFEETQALVHVVTGSLKGSGRVSSETDDNSWTGEISYGGPAPGFAHPYVRYARKEFGKGEGHDALRNVHLIGEDILHAMGATVRARLQ
jgi:hypothetical protein